MTPAARNETVALLARALELLDEAGEHSIGATVAQAIDWLERLYPSITDR